MTTACWRDGPRERGRGGRSPTCYTSIIHDTPAAKGGRARHHRRGLLRVLRRHRHHCRRLSRSRPSLPPRRRHRRRRRGAAYADRRRRRRRRHCDSVAVESLSTPPPPRLRLRRHHHRRPRRRAQTAYAATTVATAMPPTAARLPRRGCRGAGGDAAKKRPHTRDGGYRDAWLTREALHVVSLRRLHDESSSCCSHARSSRPIRPEGPEPHQRRRCAATRARSPAAPASRRGVSAGLRPRPSTASPRS